MIITYDTEFHENGKTIDLISIGMINERGDEFYAVSSEFDEDAAWAHGWLPDNVMCYLPVGNDGRLDHSHPEVMSRAMICRGVDSFIKRTMIQDMGKQPELWGYFSSYDHICLAQLHGTMLDLPPYIPMFTRDVMQEWQRIGGSAGLRPPKPDDLHNALADARWTMEFVRNVLNHGS